MKWLPILSIDSKMTKLDQKIQNLDKKINSTTYFKTNNRTPQKPTSSPIRSTNTPLKQFGATKTVHETTPIQNYFHHNLKFEHQGDTYYLQDRDFLKNSPKIRNSNVR